MLAGELYGPLDCDLVARRARARDLCQALNGTGEHEPDQRRAILRLSMKRRSMKLGAQLGLVFLALSCRSDQANLSRFPADERVAIRAALDSFPELYNEPTAVEHTSRRGDTVIVRLISARGAADPGKWDGPRLDVWVIPPARIIRSAQMIVN